MNKSTICSLNETLEVILNAQWDNRNYEICQLHNDSNYVDISI